MNTKDKKNMFWLHFEKRYSFAAIGRLYKVSRERVRQIINPSEKNLSFENIYAEMNECVKCRINQATNIHHLIRDIENPRFNDPDNIVALCRDCHEGIHEKKDEIRRID